MDYVTDETTAAEKDEQSDAEDEKPEISEEETVVVPDDVDDVDHDAVDIMGSGATNDDDDEIEPDSNDDDDETTETDPATDPVSGSGEWGDLGIDALQTVTNSIVEQGGGEPVDRDHFEDLRVDEHFDRLLEERDIGKDMPPEKALLVSVALSVGIPVLVRTDILDTLVDDIMDSDQSDQ